MTTVIEFHCVAGQIQCLHSNEPLQRLFITLLDNLSVSCQKLGRILPNKDFFMSIKLNMILMKVVPLNLYSNKV